MRPTGTCRERSRTLFSIDEVKWGQQIEKIIGILASYVFLMERWTEPGCFKAATRQPLRLNTLQWSTVLILQPSQASKVFGQRCSKEREREREESETRRTGCGDVRGRDVRRGHGVRGHTEADIRSLVTGCSHSGQLLHSVFPAWQTALIYSNGRSQFKNSPPTTRMAVQLGQ